MNVVGINGSGRKDGNTAVLVRAVLDGAKEAGAGTEFIQLADWHITGCDDCKACKEDHRCVMKDDMQRFYDLAPETDVLVLASPIYLDHITAQLMTFIQRTYCYIGRALENYWPKKDVRAVLGITYGASSPTGYDCVLNWMAGRMEGYFDIPTVGTFKIHSTAHDPVIKKSYPEVQRAHAFGKSLGG